MAAAEHGEAELSKSVERALFRAARGAASRQQVRAAARRFARRHRHDRGYLLWVLRSVAAGSALASGLLGLAMPMRAELTPFHIFSTLTPPIPQDVGVRSTPVLADLDRDGDLDLVAGASAGTFFYYENTGSAESFAFTTAANPFTGFSVGVRSAPALGDLDGDGDLDLVAGTSAGTFAYYENTGSASPAFVQRTGTANPLDGQDVGINSLPALADLDGDGDLDLIAGDEGIASAFDYFENIGSSGAPVFVPRTGSANPMASLGNGYWSPALADLDGDGDLDLTSGRQTGGFLAFENTGTALAPAFIARTGTASSFNGSNLDAGSLSHPTFGDLDGDGDPDLVSGNDDGTFVPFASAGGRFMRRTAVGNPLAGQDVGSSSKGTLGDLDADGDLDFVAGAADGLFKWFSNTGSAASPAFASVPTHPLSGQATGAHSFPRLVDLDDDGDLDVISGASDGTFRYFKNIGNAISPSFATQTGSANPLGFTDVGDRSVPTFGDLDGDGDLDLITGNQSGTVVFFENLGSATTPTFSTLGLTLMTCNPPGGGRIEPSLGDLDGDGDLDLIAGTGVGFAFCENTGTSLDPQFVIRSGAANPLVNQGEVIYYLNAALGDLDADGDLDFVSGRWDGFFEYFERVRPWTPSTFRATGAASPLNGQDIGDLSAPAAADLDGDGDADLVVGDELGTFRFFENTGSLLLPAYAARTGTANPLNGRTVGDDARPALGDLDGDGDADLLAGRGAGDFDYFANTGDAETPAFASSVANPFGLAALPTHSSSPALADLDHDGDLDLVAGQYYGGLVYYQNTGSATVPGFARQTGPVDPFDDLALSYYTTPALGDYDEDGDLDVAVGGWFGRFLYLENAGGRTDPHFQRETGAANPLDGEDVGDRSAPAAVDLDHDGDSDLLTGTDAGTFAVHYFPEPARGWLFAAGAALLAMLWRRHLRGASAAPSR